MAVQVERVRGTQRSISGEDKMAEGRSQSLRLLGDAVGEGVVGGRGGDGRRRGS